MLFNFIKENLFLQTEVGTELGNPPWGFIRGGTPRSQDYKKGFFLPPDLPLFPKKCFITKTKQDFQQQIQRYLPIQRLRLRRQLYQYQL